MAREMKDSGNTRVGSIPIHWKIGRLKHVAQLYTGNSIKDDEKELYGDPIDAIPYISSKDIDATFLTANYSNGMYVKKNDLTFKIAPAGSLLMCIEGGSAGRKKTRLSQSVAFVNKLCCFNPAKINGDFLYYWICSPNFEDEFKENISGLIGGVSVSSLQNFTIALPSSTEQMRIASFLDRKCAEIDSVIADTQRTIEEYKKLKQSVITQAVTKGIRGERPMKDSGVEWIGEIVDGFSIIKLKHLLKEPLMYGANETGITFDENLPRYIRITDITMDGKLKDTGKLSLTEDAAENYILQNNDVLFARSGASVGKAFIYKETYGRSAFAGYLIKASIGEKLLADYLFFYTQSSLYEEWKKQIFVQATIQNIGADRYSILPVVLGSIEEQQEIVNYLEIKCAEIDKLIADKTHLLEELENYKKSVIYEYVTGKKEVPACQ